VGDMPISSSGRSDPPQLPLFGYPLLLALPEPLQHSSSALILGRSGLLRCPLACFRYRILVQTKVNVIVEFLVGRRWTQCGGAYGARGTKRVLLFAFHRASIAWIWQKVGFVYSLILVVLVELGEVDNVNRCLSTADCLCLGL
jgi:hypothetical protein